MPPSNKTTTSIPETKTSFLQSQTRLLSAPLHPSPSWQDQSSSSSTPTDPLPDKIVTDLLAKLNAKIKSHTRLVFSPPSQRHVAEQIDSLYWSEVVAETRGAAAADEVVWIPRDADLTDRAVLEMLPVSLTNNNDNDNEDDGDGVGDAGDEYTRLRERALELGRRRDELKTKVERYRRLRRLLGPFENAAGQVQPNLVTRDGEVSRELERMRVLVARVEGGLGREGVRVKREGKEEMDGRQRLARVMELG